MISTDADTLTVDFNRFGPAEYGEFLSAKSHLGDMPGFAPTWMPDFLFDFQASLVEWLIRRGRAALFADCGLGKTPMQLAWAENVIRHTNRPVLILTPLGVAAQTVREGEKFGIECTRSESVGRATVHVANYERLSRFDQSDFAGVVCDESSILKNFAGSRRKDITEFLRTVQYRLLCTATAAPNDFIELGTSSEAVGELGHMDMLARFFKNDDKTLFLHGTKYGDLTQKGWKFKPHAEEGFWRWVCSWARACRKPSDLGFSDSRFVLPELLMREHAVRAMTLRDGFLFEVPAETLSEQQEEQRRTVPERCESVAALVDHDRPAVCWCHLNEEGDTLTRLIPDAVQVSGSDPVEAKEEAFAAFSYGQIRVLVTKPKIGGFGMNWQHCGHQTFFPSHSFEQWYQCVRRSLRFGRSDPVVVDVVSTDGSAGVLANLRRKAAAAERMFDSLVRHMNKSVRIGRTAYGNNEVEAPTWL